MKRRHQSGTDKTKTVKRKKGKSKGGSWFFFFLLFVLFSVSVAGSYIYFKPIFVFDSSFIDDIGEGRSRSIKSEKKSPGRLYSSNVAEETEWYNAEHRKDSAIVIVENIVRKYLESYSTSLLDLYVDKDGVIYIDIGKEIIKNFKGDAYEEYNVIAGLCSAIKANMPDFTALKIIIDGQEAESFGGHIDISRPIRGDISGIADKI
jgi:hypothetical protein